MGCSGSKLPPEGLPPVQKSSSISGGIDAEAEEREGSIGFRDYVIDTSSLRMQGGEGKLEQPDEVVFKKPENVRKIIRTSLEKNFIFQALSKTDIEKLIDVFKPVSCALNEAIIEEGSQGDFMCVRAPHACTFFLRI